MIINLMSDTVTQPTPPMLQAMMSATTGDDVFGEDPTINELEAKLAKMFGKEAAIFCPSGTMTNQIAIKIHTQPLDEMICEENSHVYQYETGGYAFNSAIAVNLVQGNEGKMTAAQVEAAIKPLYDWLPQTRLVVLENTTNKGGGSYYSLAEIKAIKEVCDRHGLILHLDGARLFNALVETGIEPHIIGAEFASISICLSKGLGAPVGSVLLGTKEDIRRARRFRKVMGGGMRQAGYLAAAGIYALDNHVERLRDDHQRARVLAAAVSKLSFVENIRPVKTNIVIFDVQSPVSAERFLAQLDEHNIKAVAFGPQTVRFVTHLDFTDEMLTKVVDVIEAMEP